MKILALGDSFTYGEELSDPCNEGWIWIVARELGAELRNVSRPGCSNDYIIKRLMREILEYHERPDLVVIGWSSCSRIEEADDELLVWDSWPGRQLIGENKGTFREDRIKYRTLYNNEMWEYRRWLRQVILVQDFLNQRNLDFRFLNCFHNQHLVERKEYTPLFLDQAIDAERFYGWKDRTGMIQWCLNPLTHEPYDKMPRGHPGPVSNRKIADKFLEFHKLFRSDI